MIAFGISCNIYDICLSKKQHAPQSQNRRSLSVVGALSQCGWRLLGMVLNKSGKVGRAAKAECAGNVLNRVAAFDQPAARCMQHTFCLKVRCSPTGLGFADARQMGWRDTKCGCMVSHGDACGVGAHQAGAIGPHQPLRRCLFRDRVIGIEELSVQPDCDQLCMAKTSA